MLVRTYHPYRIYHYVSDDEFDDFYQRWNEWEEERGVSAVVTAGSASYSEYRPVLFCFEEEEEAVLFRLFFGGSLEPTFSPTLSKR